MDEFNFWEDCLDWLQEWIGDPIEGGLYGVLLSNEGEEEEEEEDQEEDQRGRR